LTKDSSDIKYEIRQIYNLFIEKTIDNTLISKKELARLQTLFIIILKPCN